jgi:Ca2+/Na+ antiporter
VSLHFVVHLMHVPAAMAWCSARFFTTNIHDIEKKVQLAQ